LNNIAVFLDRDGTLNADTGYPSGDSDISLLPGASRAVRIFNQAGLLVIVVSNQSGVGRGYFETAAVERFNQRLAAALAEAGGDINAFYFCPHAPGADGEAVCGCRKPGTGLFLQAAAERGIDLRSSYMIGDKDSDIIAGSRAGCATVLLGSPRQKGFQQTVPDFHAPDMTAAAAWIMNQVNGGVGIDPVATDARRK
jgi:D-glycero-D-manno-heptose 1,7-bisphosphate phosphatase